MALSPTARARRKAALKARIQNTGGGDFMPRCTIADPTGLAPPAPAFRPCGRPTARAAGKGFSAFLCRYHTQRKARHGSPWHRGYRASDLKPYLRVATNFIADHRQDPFIIAALNGLDHEMAFAGEAELVSRLRGKSPPDRAKQALARMRDRGVRPERLLAIHFAMSALIEDDPGSHRVREFRPVQTAKAAHRLASGTHKVWEVRDDAGKLVQRTELHGYSRSSGRMLRYLGEMIDQECRVATDQHLQQVRDMRLLTPEGGNSPKVRAPSPPSSSFAPKGFGGA